MIILVNRGSYEIIENKPFILKTPPLGSGIAVGFIHPEKRLFGLFSYIFPYKEEEIEIDDAIIYSGEGLFQLIQRELDSRKVDLGEMKWLIAGASEYKGGSSYLELPERNLKMAESWFKRNQLWERVIKKVKVNYSLSLEVNGKEGFFEIKFRDEVERYE